MRSSLLQSLSNICLRSVSPFPACPPACISGEVLAASVNTLTRGFRTESGSGFCPPCCSACSHVGHRHDRDGSLLIPQQLLSLKHFTSSTSTWQDAVVPVAGINPLMQTPGPASSSAKVPQAAAAPENRTAQAVLRKTRISPKKLNEFAKLIRRMHIDDALVQCQVAPKKAAKLCYKLLLSAKDNAEKDKGLDPDKLRVDRAFVGRGQNFKRMNTHARGRSGVRLVYHAHLTIILAEGSLKRVTQFRPPNAQWHKNRQTSQTLRAAS
ncbi:hypothetical protein ABBQ32_003843 [Trebouxia sp. C0010 RCD-2024]